MKISCLSSILFCLLLCQVTPTDARREKKQEEAKDAKNIIPEESFLGAPLPERLVNNIFHHSYYSRGDKSSKGATKKGQWAGKSTKSSKAGKSKKGSKPGKSSKSSKPGKGAKRQWAATRPSTPRPTPRPPTRTPTSAPTIQKAQNQTGVPTRTPTSAPPIQQTTNRTGCLNETRLVNGATLSVNIASLLGGATILISESINIDGATSIGQGANQGAQNHWTYVIDVSYSTTSSCGIPGKTILDCEKDSVLGLQTAIEASGSAVDFGLASFASTGTSTMFNESSVTTDRGAQEGDIATAVNSLSSIFSGTNFSAGLDAAIVSVAASSASKKYVIFLSDGESVEGGSDFPGALAAMKNLNATIFSFAVGSGSSCTGGSSGTLQKMANATGGRCQNVTNAANLSDILTNLVTTRMVQDGLTVDGVVVGATKTNAPPFNGPGSDQLRYTVPASSLAVGNHTACISATGLGPADVPSSEKTAQCCVIFALTSPAPTTPTPRPTLSRIPTRVPIIAGAQNQTGAGCLNETRLVNGATLSVNITSLLGGFLTSDSIKIDGVTSIGQGANQGAQNHWTYVIDVSGSTAFACGIPGKTILDCEKDSVLGLHTEVEAIGSTVDFGLASFASTGTSTLFNGSSVTTDRGAQDGDITTAVNALRSIGGTNFSAGLEAAMVSVAASPASKKYVVFLSDGAAGPSGSDFATALAALKNLNATIFSFAVGRGSSCGTVGSSGTLQEMANATGGRCQNVTNAASLSDILTNLVTTRMVQNGLTINGDFVGATKTNAPPFNGPGSDQLSYTLPASSLAVGNHTACISATGLGPADVPSSEQTAQCCVIFALK